MPTLSIQQDLLRALVESRGRKHDVADMAFRLPLMGTDIDSCDDETLDIEIFPDRPDLLSPETLVHGMMPFLHDSPPQPRLAINPGTISMRVSPEIKNIRPVILGAVIRGVKITEEIIKRLMDHQEKLHFALGRGRKRASIGVHDLATLTPPFRVEAVSRDHAFTPLAMEQDMSIEKILSEHPKGVDYAHLLEGMEKVPVIIDANNSVLSFPPIINGNHTTVTENTRDLFIDVTGFDSRACESSLMLICLQLAVLGGKIESVRVTTCEGSDWSIDGSPKEHFVERNLVEGILGNAFTDDQIEDSIRRMGGVYNGDTSGVLSISMPRWRYDILHPIDLVEEVAIGHGYDDLAYDVPKSPLTAIPRSDGQLRRRIREALQGLSLIQIQSLTLSNDSDQFTSVRWKADGAITRMTNPITTEHTILRQNILPGLLRLLAANRHHDLPQGVYELGTVVVDHKNRDRFAFLVAERTGGFASLRGRIQALMRDLGCSNWSLETIERGPWLPGRSASIVVEGVVIGECGEIDPLVSESFELNVPMSGAQIDVTALASVLEDPVH
ncbi:MAG: phenylalanine--tRNA ligase subunit beta [Euryarchaeota archaeon]|jgi:phenylalanyl-tRNA synthetase beta chain|nr:phenylalanine--tRNA ligase subunit beta [Euryarchaeota archaeon]MBT4982698.1 phenylalanine--tRNA ligase subunit beta [Euryarchaeota archaeon]MBT5183884.1 phenylalanine--tRNA ligase subunit beta [Euryarchaeota archaeon]